ncbi:MAG: fatty acid desaturase [Pseudomonadota bacterium]
MGSFVFNVEWLNGVITLPWWGYVLVALALTHITIASVTIFLHRHQAHRSLELHAIPSHFFRFWLWLTTGMVTKEWAAIHRKHHAYCEKENDPHSPKIFGIKKVFWEGAELYRDEAKNQATLSRFGQGTPNDWIENHLYTPHAKLGIAIMMVINLILFGPLGLSIWAVQMIWIPVWAAGVVNGIGHYWGYRNFEASDNSTNIIPWGIIIGGEELHNNHHAYATSAKLSNKWYEFDIGWFYIRILEILGLAKAKKTIPQIKFDLSKTMPDLASLQSITTHRYVVLIEYVRMMRTLGQKELRDILESKNFSSKTTKQWWALLRKNSESLTETEAKEVQQLLQASSLLRTLYDFYQSLQKIWERSSASAEDLVKELQMWCERAQASGITQLADFSKYLARFA